MTMVSEPGIEISKEEIDRRFAAGEFEGLLEVLDRTGDTKIMWNRRNSDEVSIAKKAFEEAKKKGMRIFRVGDKEGKPEGEPVTEFDPTEERLIAVPQLVGG